jgi:acetate kinase
MTTSLDGLDALVFSGGAGEGSPPLRAAVCARLEHLGVAIDAVRNGQPAGPIGADGAAVAVLVVPAGEEIVIAREAASLLGARRDGGLDIRGGGFLASVA